ncbi:MAG: TonB-dependent siderophore receptor [Sphingobium sp.]
MSVFNHATLRPATVRPRASQASLLGAATLAALFMPGAAHASTPDDASDAERNPTIYVTAPLADQANPNANPEAPYKVERSTNDKFTEPLRDTPKTVIAIPKEVIADIGASSFREVVRSTPGVTLGTGEGGNAFGDRIFIRGFEARNDVYIDGMRDPGVTSREVFAVEQIEVIKGPSGSFGGRGTTGGLVSLQSKQPEIGKSFAVVEGGIGTENFYRGTVDANVALGQTFALRVNGLYHNADTPGRDYVGAERYGVAASALWKPTDELSISADYYGFRLNGMSDYGHPFENANYNDGTINQPAKVNADNFYGVVGRDFLNNGSDIGTLTVRYAPSDKIALRSTVRYGQTWNYYVVSVPRAPRVVASTPSASDAANGFTAGQLVVDTGTPQRHGDNDTFAIMNDATVHLDTGSIGHTIVAGFEMAHEKVTNRRYAFATTVEDSGGNIIATPGSFTRDLFNPNPVLGYHIPAVLDPNVAPTIIKVESMSAYLIDTIKFSPQWEVLLGARYDTFDIAASGPQGATTFNRRASLDFMNYQASLIYKPVTPLSIYASYSTSSNPSGEQLDSIGADYGGLALGTETLEPERNRSIELGTKYEINPHLLFTAALFQTTKANAREQISPNNFALVGKLRSRGVELGVSGNITPRLALFGGFTYIDATITRSNTAANVGARFANIPKYNASLLATYALNSRLTVGGQAYYQSNLHGGTYAPTVTTLGLQTTVPGYWRFDAVARFKPTKATELRLNVLNLTDKRYYDAIYRSGTPFAYVAPGRSATLTGSIRF